MAHRQSKAIRLCWPPCVVCVCVCVCMRSCVCVCVVSTLSTNDMAHTLCLLIGMSLCGANTHYYLYCMYCCSGHILVNVLPLAAFVSSVLVLCTLTNLFTVEFMRLSSVHVYTTHFTLTDRPIRSLHSLPISLMMGAQHTDLRLNPCDVCTLWQTTIIGFKIGIWKKSNHTVLNMDGNGIRHTLALWFPC